VKDEDLKKHFQSIKSTLTKAPFQFVIRHVPREKNQEADQLANRGIDTKKHLKV
jgi:ribonuclease HI